MWQDAAGLKRLQILVYFMGVPIEDKANKVNLEYEVHKLGLQKNLSENTSEFRLLYGHAYSKWSKQSDWQVVKME